MALGDKQPRTKEPRTFIIETIYNETLNFSAKCQDEAKSAYAKHVIRTRPRIAFKEAIKHIKSCRINPAEKFKTGPIVGGKFSQSDPFDRGPGSSNP